MYISIKLSIYLFICLSEAESELRKQNISRKLNWFHNKKTITSQFAVPGCLNELSMTELVIMSDSRMSQYFKVVQSKPAVAHRAKSFPWAKILKGETLCGEKSRTESRNILEYD